MPYTTRPSNVGAVDVVVLDDGGPPAGSRSWTVTAAGIFDSSDFDSGTQTGSQVVAGLLDGREYAIVFDAVNQFDTPTASNITTDASPHTFTGDYIRNSGNVTVTPTESSASWVLTGLLGYNSGLQIGTQVLTDLPLDTYTATFDDNLLGFTAPGVDFGDLGTSGTLALSGTYVARSTNATITIEVWKDGVIGDAPPVAGWTVSSTDAVDDPFSETGNFDDAAITGPVYVGRNYLCVADDESGYTTPVPSPTNWTATEAGSHTFDLDWLSSSVVTRDLDANGWSVFNTPGTGGTLYVSAAGSDSYDGLSPTFTGGSNGPKLTLPGAWSDVVNGQEWHVKLRNGDTFTSSSAFNLNKGGATRTTPILITQYADGTAGHTVNDDRPIFQITGNRWEAFSVSVSNICVTDLIVRWTGIAGSDHSLSNYGATGVLFEGIWFDGMGRKSGGVTNSGDINGGASSTINDHQWRRNVYNLVSGDITIYRQGYGDLLMEECLVDPEYHGDVYSDHIFYFNGHDRSLLRGNIFARAGDTNGNWKFASEQAQTLDNWRWHNNVFDLGANSGAALDDGNLAGSDRFTDCEFIGNVCYGFGKKSTVPVINPTTTIVGWGDWDTGQVRDNLFTWGIRDETQEFYTGNEYPNFWQIGSISTVYHMTGNVWADFWQLRPDESYPMKASFSGQTGSTFQDNIIEGMDLLLSAVSVSNATFDNNTYYSPGAQSGWFDGYGSVAAWVSATGETNSDYRTSAVPFLERRTFEQYHEDVLGAVSGNYEQMITDLRSRYNKRDWGNDLTDTPVAQGIWSGTNFAAWMRAGYTKV